MKGITKGGWFPNKIGGIIIGVNAEIESSEKGCYSENVCEFILPDTDNEYRNSGIEERAKLICTAGNLTNAGYNIEAMPQLYKIIKGVKEYFDNPKETCFSDAQIAELEEALKSAKP